MVELIIVMSIVVMLSTIALAGFNKIRETTKVARCTSEIRGMEREISAWAVEKGSYPSGLVNIGRAILKDPWGNPYNYGPPGERMAGGDPINTDYDLYSNGGDGNTAADGSIVADESLDDIIRGRDGAYAGLAAEF